MEESIQEIRGILLDTLSDSVSMRTIEISFESLSRNLNCCHFDYVSRYMEDDSGKLHRLLIVCDDDALMKDGQILSAVYEDGKPALFGNLFICSSGKYGDLLDIDAEAAATVLSSIRTCRLETEKTFHKVISEICCL